MKTQTHTVHFKVDFEGMTRLIRSVWSEGNYGKATNLLDGCGVPNEYWGDIISGKLKMVDADPENPGIEGDLAEDDWKPDPANSQYGIYPTIEEMPALAQRAMELRSIYEEDVRIKARSYKEAIATSINALEKIRLAKEAKTEFPLYIMEEIELDTLVNVILSGRLARSIEPEERYRAQTIVDSYIRRQMELDKIETVEQDKEFKNPYGAISKDGKFYPCGWMEHDWLFDRLSTTKDNAHEDGWVFVSKELLSGKTIMTVKALEPTQKQIDAIFDYCQVHGMENYPDWIEEE